MTAAGGSFWDQQWGTQRQTEGLLENTQRHVQEQATYGQLQAQHLQDRMSMENQGQLQNQFPANVPARPVAPRQHVPQTVTAPTAPNHNAPNVPHTAAAPTAPNFNPPTVPWMPAALPSAPAQPAQLPAAPPAASRPTLPPGLPLAVAQRPPTPVGFNDQPQARMLPSSYLTPHLGTPRRNVQWPENIEISLVEIATFCPNWFHNPEVISRAIRNGWSREGIAKAQLLAEDPATRDDFKTVIDRVQQQISRGCKLLDGQPIKGRFNASGFRSRRGAQNDLTANAWQFRHNYNPSVNALEHLGDMPLSAFYAHVQTWPTGNDRLLMTQCLEFAFRNPRRQLDTSHWNWIITSQGFAPPPPLANGQHRDHDALERLGHLPNPL